MTEDEQQEILLAHARDTSLRGSLSSPAETYSKNNPLCGDVVTFSILFSGEEVRDVRAEPQGCFICRASTSILASALKNKTKEQAGRIAKDFRQMMHGEPPSSELKAAGDFVTLEGICKYPLRIKCALLPFDVVEMLLKQER